MRKNKSTKLKIQPRVPSTYARPHANLRVFVDVDVPEGTQNVVLSDNRFVDFVGFNAVSSIESINFDNNPILSFRGFPKMPNLRILSMLGTPISGLPTFRAQAIACCPQLRVINGSEVTSKEKSNAAAFGDPDVAYELISRGWLPKKPIALQPLRERDPNLESDRKKKKKNVPAPNSERIERIVAMQDSDPVSVRVVRILRAQGMDIAQIRSFLRKHFAPTKERQTLSKTTKKKQDSGIEAQIQRQQEIINVMAAQLQALRTGNRTFNEYNEMLSVAGRPLIENAEFLSKLENGESLEQNKERKGFRPDYAVLRAAVLEFLEADESTPDKELIGFLNEIAEEEEKKLAEEHESSSSSSSSSSSTFEIESEKETEEEDQDEDKEVLHTGFYSDTSEETAPKPVTEKREEDLIPKELEEEEEEILELQKQDSIHSEKSSTDDSEQEVKELVEEEDINENNAHEVALKDSSSSSNTDNEEVQTKQENLEPAHNEEEELRKDSDSSSSSDNEDNLEPAPPEEIQKDSNIDNEENQDNLEPAHHEEEEAHKESSSSSNSDNEEPEEKQENLEPPHHEEEEPEKDSNSDNEEPEEKQGNLEPSHHEEEEQSDKNKSDKAEIAATEGAAPPQPNEPNTTSDDESTSESVNNSSDENISTDQEGLLSQD